jgi:ATP-dependent DNA helicase RecG
MYTLSTPLGAVHGIGEMLRKKLYDQEIRTVLDLLLSVPLRYEDRSDFRAIDELEVDQLATIKATVQSISSFYKNKRLISSAVVVDETDRLKLMWFNNRFVNNTLKAEHEYYFSGKLSKYGTMTQPTFEAVKRDTIHTNRLVPLYTSTLDFKQGTLRRILKHICDELQPEQDILAKLSARAGYPLPDLATTFKQLHFPDEAESVVLSRERLAMEELLNLIKHSQSIKAEWQKSGAAVAHILPAKDELIPRTIPFALTPSQLRSLDEILSDLQQSQPMNRLLIGDVGSGKTVVAGLALRVSVQNGGYGCLVAPTQILAEQHAQTLVRFFPDVPIVFLTGKGMFRWQDDAWQPEKRSDGLPEACLLVGTHAVLNFLNKQTLQRPLGMIVYDEQHRFGVKQRANIASLSPRPHVLTMTATPIPRSLMLTIFSHLELSTIDELPKNRVPTKTWVLPESKRASMFAWLLEQMGVGEERKEGQEVKVGEGKKERVGVEERAGENKQEKRAIGAFLTLVVCPFIDQSAHESLTNVAAAAERFAEITASVPDGVVVELLHGKLNQTEKDRLLKRLFAQEIDILVTTPIVEVGMDLPQASAIVIEAAERFGMASLHQLRGRVGRAGQQGYCLLFQSGSGAGRERLKQFEQIHNGRELAELDLRHRGAGDLFGTAQHGFDQLQFASWTNLELIAHAQKIAQQLPPDWKSILQLHTEDDVPAAN